MLNVDFCTYGIGLPYEILKQPFGSFMYRKIGSSHCEFEVLNGDFWYIVTITSLIYEPRCQ